MNIRENVILGPYTSMFVGGPAKYFIEASSIDELAQAVHFSMENKLPIFILGGGSNILVSDKGYLGLVIKINIKGIEKKHENDEVVHYEVSAGEGWDSFVKFCVENNLYGIENLSHIPGTVGASVVQNIGAYGQEVSTSVVSVKVLDKLTLAEKVFRNEDMDFSYRKSVLNDPTKEKDKYVVTSVVFSLNKNSDLCLNYDDIKKYFGSENIEKPALLDVRMAIIEIRNSKFPYPDKPESGTVGSFWNAEVVDDSVYESIISKLEVMGHLEKAETLKKKKSAFTVKQGLKVPYGVLIEALGYKGKEFGDVRILPTHSGVINNHTGKAKAMDVHNLSKEIIDAVYKEFGIKIRPEPEFLGDFN